MWSSKGRPASRHQHRWSSAPRPGSVPSPRRHRCAIFRQARRLRVPCFSTSPSPDPHSRRPVLSTNRWMGLEHDCGRGTAKVAARRLRVEWSGTASPRSLRTEPIRPSVSPGLVMRLAARWRAGLGPPGGDRRLREPDRETASLTQAGVVFGPIRHLMPLLRNAVTASGIGFEWHGRNRWSGAEEASTLPSRGYQFAHPCNKATPYYNGAQIGPCMGCPQVGSWDASSTKMYFSSATRSVAS